MENLLPIVGYIHQGQEYMPVYEGGLISREPGRKVPAAYCRPTGKWILRGAVERNNFGNVVRRYSQAEVLSGKIVWYHKNRKQKVFLLDIDHGTNREMGSGLFLPKGRED
jgi:hypothetical protein